MVSSHEPRTFTFVTTSLDKKGTRCPAFREPPPSRFIQDHPPSDTLCTTPLNGPFSPYPLPVATQASRGTTKRFCVSGSYCRGIYFRIGNPIWRQMIIKSSARAQDFVSCAQATHKTLVWLLRERSKHDMLQLVPVKISRTFFRSDPPALFVPSLRQGITRDQSHLSSSHVAFHSKYYTHMNVQQARSRHDTEEDVIAERTLPLPFGL